MGSLACIAFLIAIIETPDRLFKEWMASKTPCLYVMMEKKVFYYSTAVAQKIKIRKGKKKRTILDNTVLHTRGRFSGGERQEGKIYKHSRQNKEGGGVSSSMRRPRNHRRGCCC